MKATASLVIDKPIEEVFAYISTIENMEHWVSGVSEAKPVTAGDTQVGTAFTSLYTYNRKTHDYEYVVVTHQAPQRYGVKATKGPYPFESQIELTTVGTGTQITNTIESASDHWATSIIFAVFGALLRKMMHKRLLGELTGLKAILEG